MRSPLPREQGRRLTVAGLIAAVALLAHGPAFTSATFTDSTQVSSSAFTTGTWCGTNVYPSTVLATVPAARNYLRLDETGMVVFPADSAAGPPPTGVVSGTGHVWGATGLLDCSTSTGLGLTGSGTPQVRTGGPAINGPDLFTISLWTNLTGGQGRILGFSNAATGSSSRYDRHLYLDNTGRIRFGIWTGSATTIQTNAPVTGSRHHIVATLGPAGMRLYVDGVRQTQVNAGVTQGEQGYTGYWRVGWDNLSGWSALGSTAPVPVGTIDEVAIWHSQLTAAQVAALAAANHD